MSMKSTNLSLKIGSLFLDHKNTRIPEDRRANDQRALVHELLESENVKNLASSISKLGLFPNERLVVMKEGRRFIVLEGNRRVAAIKLLINPELAPTKQLVKFFRKLSSEINLSDISTLDAVLVPDRISASPIIAALHTRSSKKKWSTLQQARYYRELVDEGLTSYEIAETIGITLGQVKNYLRAEKLYSLANSLEYPPDTEEKIKDPRFPLSTLERFLESKVGRAFLGVELDEDHGFRGIVHPERFQAVLKQIVTDIVTKRSFTREINDEDGFKDYISRTDSNIPRTRIRGTFLPNELLNGNSDDTPQIDPPKPASPKPKRQPPLSKSIIPIGFSCTTKHARIKAIFKELKSLRVKEQPNSTGVMLRVLIEISIWNFLKEISHEIDVCNKYDPTKKRRKNNPNWVPSLRDLISYSVDERLFPNMTPDEYKSVRTLAAKDTSYFVNIEGFNIFTHNPNVIPTENDLRALWLRAEPMLKVILNNTD